MKIACHTRDYYGARVRAALACARLAGPGSMMTRRICILKVIEEQKAVSVERRPSVSLCTGQKKQLCRRSSCGLAGQHCAYRGKKNGAGERRGVPRRSANNQVAHSTDCQTNPYLSSPRHREASPGSFQRLPPLNQGPESLTAPRNHRTSALQPTHPPAGLASCTCT